MKLDPSGWVIPAEHQPSPNFDARPGDSEPRLIVVHAISLPPGVFGGPYIVDFFLNRLDANADPYFKTIAAVTVSAHFLIRRDGTLIQFVSCNDRAWHAGASCWKGVERCNDFSIGIELEGCDEIAFEGAQYETLNALVTLIRRAFPIDDVVGHSDIAPGRKTDPGPYFDWRKVDCA